LNIHFFSLRLENNPADFCKSRHKPNPRRNFTFT
jgi:hypothetical protein